MAFNPGDQDGVPESFYGRLSRHATTPSAEAVKQ